MIKVEVVVEQQMAQVVEEEQIANEINQKRLKIVHTCSNANCTHILKSGTAYTTVKKSATNWVVFENQVRWKIKVIELIKYEES